MQSEVIKSISALRKFIKKIPPQRVVLFVTKAKNYQKANIEILKTIIMLNKFSGIYITTGRPYSVISENLKNAGIDVGKVFFIDCVTRMYLAPKGIVLGKPGMEMTQECLYLASPANLTELGIALSQAVIGIKEPKNKFIFVDSLSMLLIYNDENTVIKFVHFLTTKVKLFGLIGIIMVMEKGTKGDLLATMHELCDVVVEVKV
jgi:hypothetical protein